MVIVTDSFVVSILIDFSTFFMRRLREGFDLEVLAEVILLWAVLFLLRLALLMAIPLSSQTELVIVLKRKEKYIY